MQKKKEKWGSRRLEAERDGDEAEPVGPPGTPSRSAGQACLAHPPGRKHLPRSTSAPRRRRVRGAARAAGAGALPDRERDKPFAKPRVHWSARQPGRTRPPLQQQQERAPPRPFPPRRPAPSPRVSPREWPGARRVPAGAHQLPTFPGRSTHRGPGVTDTPAVRFGGSRSGQPPGEGPGGHPARSRARPGGSGLQKVPGLGPQGQLLPGSPPETQSPESSIRKEEI